MSERNRPVADNRASYPSGSSVGVWEEVGLDPPIRVLRSSKPRTKRFSQLRNYWCDRTLCYYYRTTTVQIITKSITSVPFLVLWVLWVTGVLRQEDNWDMVIYNLILSGSIITYPWLGMCCWFNLLLMLHVWSIFSMFWSVLSFLAGVQLFLVEPLTASVLILLGLMCLLDGILSNGVRLLSLPEENDETEEIPEPKGISIYLGPGKGPLFFYVPLDGGRPEPITDPMPEYPSWHSDLLDLEEQDRLYWERKEGTSKDVEVIDRRSSLSEELFWQELMAWEDRKYKK